MLLVPPAFELRNLSVAADGMPPPPPIWTEISSAYTIPSVAAAADEKLRLGLLPCRDTRVPRTANVIKRADHKIWRCESGGELLEYLGKSFPQISDISSFVSTAEADAFVAGKPGSFPQPQFARQLVAHSGGTHLVLLGDAAHAFPPDVGQGVNSALEDVTALLRVMRQTGALPAESTAVAGAAPFKMESINALEASVERYQEQRAPAAEAVARIVQVACERAARSNPPRRSPPLP
eukprot:6850672-Prymnesium_polylepis.1